MTKIIEHITITTGAVRDSARSEVSNGVVDRIRAALAEENGVLWNTGWAVALLPTQDGGHVFDLSYQNTPIVRCWLCEDASQTLAMWDAAKSGNTDKRVRLLRPRRVPWLAVALLPQAMSVAMSRPQTLHEVGDLERCVAWSLIE